MPVPQLVKVTGVVSDQANVWQRKVIVALSSGCMIYVRISNERLPNCPFEATCKLSLSESPIHRSACSEPGGKIKWMYAEKECSNRHTTLFLLQLLTITTFEKDSTFVFDADKRESSTAVLIIPLPSAEGELKWKVSFLSWHLLISNKNIITY